MEGDLHDLLVQKEELDLRIVNLETDGERYRNQVKTDANTALFDLLREYYNKVYNRIHTIILLKSIKWDYTKKIIFMLY